MATVVRHWSAQSAHQLPLRKVSVANRRARTGHSDVQVEKPRNQRIAWDLNDLQVVQDAANRVRQAQNAWQDQTARAEEVDHLDRQQQLALILAEREKRDAATRAARATIAARAAEEQRLKEQEREAVRQAAVAAEARWLAEVDERRQAEAEQRRLAELERQRVEDEIAAILAQEEEDRLRAIEIEAIAEAARIAEEADERRRQVEEAERERRARLRDCAACLEQHDISEMSQVACRHWYCHGALQGKHRDLSQFCWQQC